MKERKNFTVFPRRSSVTDPYRVPILHSAFLWRVGLKCKRGRKKIKKRDVSKTRSEKRRSIRIICHKKCIARFISDEIFSCEKSFKMNGRRGG